MKMKQPEDTVDVEGLGYQDVSVKSGTSGSNNDESTTTPVNSRADIEEKLNKVKTKAVNRFRGCIIIVLILAAIGISLTVFLLSRNADIEAFEIQYEGNAAKIIDSFHSITTEHFAALAALANDATQYSTDLQVVWPNFTLSNYEGRASNARSLSGALSISINHLVTKKALVEWEHYVLQEENNYWMEAAHSHQRSLGTDNFESIENIEHSFLTQEKVDPVHIFDSNGYPTTDIGEGPFLVKWQTSPLMNSSVVNVNMFHHEVYQKKCDNKNDPCPILSYHSLQTGAAVFGGLYSSKPGSPQTPMFSPPPPTTTNSNTTAQEQENNTATTPATTTPSKTLVDPLTSYYATLQSIHEGKEVNYLGDPMSFLFLPIYENSDQQQQNSQQQPKNKNVVGIMEAVIYWKVYFRNIISENVRGITVVLSNPCDGTFTYEIQGSKVFGVGFGDLHDPKFDPLHYEANFDNVQTLRDGTTDGMKWDDLGCPFTIHIYPTQQYYDEFVTSSPINVTFAVGMVFSYTIIMFLLYDRLVEARQRLILSKASKSTALVESLFPKNFADQMLADDTEADKLLRPFMFPFGQSARIKSFLGNGGTDQDVVDGNGAKIDFDSKPIADLFPHCTIIFADISGFTAWSSTREPALVFRLLQSVYSAFDRLAQKRKVFKVETIGDCYVAVTGLPHAQPNHAVIMARFARDCLTEFSVVTQKLELTLGPGTADLGMRFGLNSGPVTAGVLRGERARFQLFGDTMNTASRMETTGIPHRIQCSQVTTKLLIEAGKEHWVRKREDMVKVKGKGVYQTFWLTAQEEPEQSCSIPSSGRRLSSTGGGMAFEEDANITCSQRSSITFAEKQNNLVQWVANILEEHMKQILIRRKNMNRNSFKLATDEQVTYNPNKKGTAMDEVVEVISLPRFDGKIAAAVSCSSLNRFNDDVGISDEVRRQLWKYVSMIGSHYNDNAFHNFEHACHVTMATNKFLQRIVTPELDDSNNEFASQLHDYTHGINSDPITLFAIVFSALIHDVDHRGVSNAQLAKEDVAMATCYKNKSVAEQNSLDLAWDLFMQDDFIDLRKSLFANEIELHRFRQVVVNVVLATDIFDKELNDLRKTRWRKAFSEDKKVDDNNNRSKEDHHDLRATIVLEHIIQASDVSHTMQHWHVYRRWNFCLFKEMMEAYRSGRMPKSPLEFWYQGELGFFDNYIIPLAGKLKDCNVFGVSSDECLNYALANRAEWEERGEEIIQDMLNQINREVAEDSTSNGN